MSGVLTEFINLLVGGLSAMATGIGSGLNDAVQKMFLEVDGQGAITGLSTLGGMTAVFAGIALRT